ncbi:unnamed protein product [Durusdinium trenchii]|uniref:Uncharacterized protein n=1 Tax=Durusdinium trenchii TaxID=1381693 RepID=A0ABP0NPE4_9DINO
MSIRLKLKGASAQVRFDSDAARCTMPRTRSGAKEPGATCDVENVYREWQDNQAVRQVAVSTDRLFEDAGEAINEGDLFEVEGGSDSESEADDAWFDQLVESTLSAEARSTENLEHPAPPEVEDASSLFQLMDIDLLSDRPPVDSPTVVKAIWSPERPVARPLQRQATSVAMNHEVGAASSSTGLVAIDLEEDDGEDLQLGPSALSQADRDEKAKQIRQLREQIVKAEMVLVPESLPLATDVDSTVPMDLSEGVPAPVQSMLRAEEAAVNAEPTPKKVSWAFTFLVGSTNSEVIGVDEPAKVLLCRDQLGLVQEKREEAEEAKQKGKGNGRGQGRGRGRGRGKSEASAAASSKALAGKGENGSPVAAKRPPAHTPERKQLFRDDAPAPAAEVSNESPAKPVKPNRKRVKKSTAPCRFPDVPMVEEAQAEKTELPSEAAAKPQPDPPMTEKKKDAPKKKAKKGKAAEAAAVSEDRSQAQLAKEGETAEPAPEPAPKIPGKTLVKFCTNHLMDAHKHEASWDHALKLFEAAQTVIKKGDDYGPQFSHWSLSLYYDTGRVGLLQKRVKKQVHVLSFGGAFCNGVSIPLEAVRLFVRFVGGDKPSGYLKDIDCEEVQAYKAALAEMVRAVAIAVALGKGPTDFAQ